MLSKKIKSNERITENDEIIKAEKGTATVLKAFFSNIVQNLFLKRTQKSEKNNYRPVSILPNISKVYESIMFKQMSEFFESSFFSKYQCGFRKGFTA